MYYTVTRPPLMVAGILMFVIYMLHGLLTCFTIVRTHFKGKLNVINKQIKTTKVRSYKAIAKAKEMKPELSVNS